MDREAGPPWVSRDPRIKLQPWTPPKKGADEKKEPGYIITPHPAVATLHHGDGQEVLTPPAPQPPRAPTLPPPQLRTS